MNYMSFLGVKKGLNMAKWLKPSKSAFGGVLGKCAKRGKKQLTTPFKALF